MTEEKIIRIANDKDNQNLKDTLKLMKHEWTIKNLAVEIAAAEGARVTPNGTERKIKEYSTSSANRRKFMMYLIRAGYENEPLTYQQLKKLLGISRTGLDTMIKECLLDKWIVQSDIIDENGKSSRAYMAADITIQTYDNYACWLYRMLTLTGIRSVAGSIEELERMIEHQEC